MSGAGTGCMRMLGTRCGRMLVRAEARISRFWGFRLRRAGRVGELCWGGAVAGCWMSERISISCTSLSAGRAGRCGWDAKFLDNPFA